MRLIPGFRTGWPAVGQPPAVRPPAVRPLAVLLLLVLLPVLLLAGCGPVTRYSGPPASSPGSSPGSSSAGPPVSSPSAASGSVGPARAMGAGGAVVTAGTVVKVTDGDTIHVAIDGGPANQDVRIIGVDTPEVVDPRKPVQCFGPQASARAHALLDRARVTLSTDPTQATVDIHGRALRVVTLSDGSNYAETTVAAGYGRAYKVRGPAPSNWGVLTADQADAQSAQRGLWAPPPAGCGGRR